VTGGTLPAPVWKGFMLAATQTMPTRPLPSAPFQAASGGTTLNPLFGQVGAPVPLVSPSGVIPVGTVVPAPRE